MNIINMANSGKLGLLALALCLTTVGSFLFAEDVSKEESINTRAKEKPHSLLQRIIDSYVNSSNTDKTLKHLLDAKMYLSTAEHDLLVSRDKQGAHDNIENALHFLAEASDVAKPANKTRIAGLVETLKRLEIKTDNNNVQAGKDNEVDKLLAVAQATLLKAKKIASPEEVQAIANINARIQKLREQIEHINLRDDYENNMHTLNDIINSL